MNRSSAFFMAVGCVLGSCTTARADELLVGQPLLWSPAVELRDPEAGDPRVSRSRVMEFDAGVLFPAAGAARAATDVVTLNLFEDVTVEARRVPRELGVGNTASWYGELGEAVGGYAVFVEKGGALHGVVRSPRAGVFEIAWAGPGLVSVRQIDEAQLPACATGHQQTDAALGRARRGVAPAPVEPAAPRLGELTVADVLLAYTSQARINAGGTAAIEAQLAAAIAETNVAYQNSLIPLQVRAVAMVETPYTQNATNMGTDLEALQIQGDGNMDELHGLREQFGADFIALVVASTTNACGIAYLMTSVDLGFDELAVSVTARGCLSGLTLPHEIGHNMGCAHDRDNSTIASHPFAYGYRAPGAAFRTIMAYAPGARITHFSNPDVLVNGQPTGNPLNHPTNPTSNALAITLNAPTFSAFRTLFTEAPGAFALVGPGDGESVSTRSPTFTWEEASSADYYSLEVDNDPGFGSPEIDEPVISGTSFTPSATPPLALAPNQTYHWRVKVTNPLGESSSTPASRSFFVPPLVPGAFSLVSPAAGQTGVSRNPTFSWTLSAEADGYELVVDDSADFSSPLFTAGGLTTNLYTWSGTALPATTTIHWKVSAVNATGSTGGVPASRSFVTLSPPPGASTLLTPADGAFVASTRPTFSWTSAALSESYRLRVSTDLGFQTLVIDAAGIVSTSFQPGAGVLSNNTRYYWQVLAQSAGGETASTPAIATFAVVVPPCAGDANGDRSVNFVDITAVLSNWGGAGPAGDANNDGAVNFSDVSNVLAFWATSCGE
ncbi:MAG: M12 family metallo-peptidase [Planctomycetota bacterium]|nr:M12 family metallo-peptidase [Planctomycetota bacterium]